jgi:carboxylesterase
LFALQRQVKRRLSRITQPLLVLQGRLDTTLDIQGAQEVIDRVNSADKKLVWLNQSSHCLALDVEWERAAEMTLTFMQRIETRA